MVTGRRGRVAAALALVAGVLAGSGAASAAPRDASCAGLSVRVAVSTGHGGHRTVTHVRVRRLSCARAASVLRAGSFALTPAGPLFTTPGYRCRSPIGPQGAATSVYRCARRRSTLRFTLA